MVQQPRCHRVRRLGVLLKIIPEQAEVAEVHLLCTPPRQLAAKAPPRVANEAAAGPGRPNYGRNARRTGPPPSCSPLPSPRVSSVPSGSINDQPLFGRTKIDPQVSDQSFLVAFSMLTSERSSHQKFDPLHNTTLQRSTGCMSTMPKSSACHTRSSARSTRTRLPSASRPSATCHPPRAPPRSWRGPSPPNTWRC